MKRLIQHAAKPAAAKSILKSHGFKIPAALKRIDQELVKLEELIQMIYAVYTGVLLDNFEEKKITSSHRILKEKEYRKMRDDLLATELPDHAAVIKLYRKCQKELHTAIEYAKLKTGYDNKGGQ